MKLFVRALLYALLVIGTSAVKVNQRAGDLSDPCGDGSNRYPTALPSKHKIVGVSKYDMVWDTSILQAALKEESSWAINRKWRLKAKYTNDGHVDRKFGFSNGFMEVKVRAGCIDCVIEVEDVIQSSADQSEFQYRSDDPFTGGPVWMSEICLAPESCKDFKCPHPKTQKFKGDSALGNTEATCCEPRLCKDEVVCEPATKWTNRTDYEKRAGSDREGCCNAIICPDNICGEGWSKNLATGLKGSTKEECCVAKQCIDWECPKPKKKKATTYWNGSEKVIRLGSSDAECCDEIFCSSFNIPEDMKSIWKMKPDAANITGSTLEKCCQAQTCDLFDCPNDTQFKPLPSDKAKRKLGSSKETCCEQMFCSSYSCKDSSLQKKFSPETRAGSTDEECCEKKFCRDYECSDASMWIHMSNIEAVTNLARRGNSDEECCEKVYCLESLCTPSSSWKLKAPEEGQSKRPGRTLDACCDKIYCDGYTCDTDYDGDGQGTQWYKKEDTNTYRWQGSTNDECCIPKYCSQYVTDYPTKFKRKEDKDGKDLLGSTDSECYDPIYCSDYCCTDDELTLKPGAESRQGSTDQECCMAKNA